VKHKVTQDYRLVRKAAYPTVEEQLDILFHEGFDAWKAVIAEIKTRIPKK